MIETKRTKQQLMDRNKRILDHARAGLTMMEIVDREGLDPGNVKGWHKLIKNAGIDIEKVRPSGPPIGLTPETDLWRFRVGKLVARLRDRFPQIEVSAMIGMTASEIKAAAQARGFCTHNWTIAQLQRLATASGLSFEEVVAGSFREIVKGKYNAVV